MRAAGWITGLLVVAVAVGVWSGHRTASSANSLTASRQAATGALISAFDDGRPDPPHKVTPPSPSPSAAPRPSGGGGSASAPPRVYAPTIVVRSTQQALINQDRAAHGLGPLTWSSCLYNVAVSNAKRIAAQEYLSHTNGPQQDLNCRLGSRAGENIGWYSGGINDVWINSKFMGSPDHYANIMGPYHYVGTAWVIGADGHGYIAVEFG